MSVKLMKCSKMADYRYCFIITIVLLVINYIRCDQKHSIHTRVQELNNISKEMYGEVTNQNVCFKKLDLEDRLMYPRGDKAKLSKLSQLWREYYVCTAQLLDQLTPSQQLPSLIIMVYQGAVARIRCVVCVEPGEMGTLRWMYAESMSTLNLTPIQYHERMVTKDSNLAIYNVMSEDAGIYQCQVGDSSGGLILVEVVDEEEHYTVVKPPASQGPHAVAPELYHGVVLFSLWASWSECSVCGKVGRRHRYGLCYVKLDQAQITHSTNTSIGTPRPGELIDFDNNLIELFEAFPDGIPCRSQYLPRTIRRLEAVQQRPSEIMIGMCKENCKDTQTMGETLGRNISNEEIYSLAQVLPKQPPLPARNTIFADFGRPIAIRCPGTTLQDVPVLWRIGTRYVVPRLMDKASGGRVHISPRDHLIFTTVIYRDANLYSCWQAGNLAGTVKLMVWDGAHTHWNLHITLVLVVIVAAIVLRCAVQGLRSIQRRQSILFHLN